MSAQVSRLRRALLAVLPLVAVLCPVGGDVSTVSADSQRGRQVDGHASRLAAGYEHSCVILDSGFVTCWGAGGGGRLGYGNVNNIGDNETPADNPVNLGLLQLPGGLRAVRLALGYTHSCAILTSGDVTCWGSGGLGYGNNNAIGDDETPAQNPVNGGIVPLPGGAKAKDITAGENFTCAVLVSGDVSCWGNGFAGKVGYGNTNHIGDDETPAQNPVNGGLVPLPGGATALMISAGQQHVCAFLDTEEVACWGDAADGQLGYGNGNDIGDDETPAQNPVNGGIVPMPAGEEPEMVAAGGRHTCAPTFAKLVCWGRNDDGQLGRSNVVTVGLTDTPADHPATGVLENSVGKLSMGDEFSCSAHSVVVSCWGDGASGALGTGSTQDYGDDEFVSAAGVEFQTPPYAIAAGGRHVCVLDKAGAVICWGSGVVGQLGYGNGNTIGDNETALQNPIGGGRVRLPQPDAAAMVAVGGAHSCSLQTSGVVRCWGFNSSGQLGNGNTNAIGDDEAVDRNPATPGGVVGVGALVAIAAGTSHTCGLESLGTVKCWGDNAVGQLGAGTPTGNFGDQPGENPTYAFTVEMPNNEQVRSISVGALHTCAVTVRGDVACWGHNIFGQLGYGNTNTIGDDEEVSAAGYVQLPNGWKALSVSAGAYHTCALLVVKAVVCWGLNTSGQLGRSNVTTIGDNETPASVTTDFGVVLVPGGVVSAVSAGDAHTCVLLGDQSVSCFGEGANGRLGYGNQNDIGNNEKPNANPVNGGRVQLPSGLKALSVSAGGQHTCAVLTDYRLSCWGEGSYGRLGTGNTTDLGDNEKPYQGTVNGGTVPLSGSPGVYAVDAGGEHTCILRAPADVTCFGRGQYGRLGYGNQNDIGDNETAGSLVVRPETAQSFATYVARQPVRLADTRAAGVTVDGRAAATGLVLAGSTLTVPIAGRAGVPIDATAVPISLVAVNPAATGYLTVYACDEARPNASNLNVTAGVTVANLAFASMSAGGDVCVYSSMNSHIIIDLSGYLPSWSEYTPNSPARVVDTRTNGATIDDRYEAIGPLAAGATLQIDADWPSIEVNGYSQVLVLNITAVGPVAAGALTVYRCGTAVPVAANLQFAAGTNTAGLVLAQSDNDAALCIHSTALTHVLVDVVGTFHPYSRMTPAENGRLYDSRPGSSSATVDGRDIGAGQLPAGTTTVVRLDDRFPFLPVNTAVLTVTAVTPGANGYLTVWPCDQPKPNSSNLNYRSGITRSVTVISKVALNGTVCVFNETATHLTVDINGSSI